MHPIDILRMQAQEKQIEPVMEYIRNNYTSWEQVSILAWIIEQVDSDDYIVSIYEAIGKMGSSVYHHPCGNRFLFDEPLDVALRKKRSRVVEEICATILLWHAPFVTGHTHAIVLACLTKEMGIVRAFMRVCGTDFVNDPELLAVILYKDYVELMQLCLRLGTDRRLHLEDGRSLWEAAVSDEMRELLDERTAPIKL